MHTHVQDTPRAPIRNRPIANRPFLTVGEAARRAYVGNNAMRSWCERGIVRATWVVSHWRIDPADLDRVLAGTDGPPTR